MQCYLNGDFVSLDEARISPLDRGFLFGDGVYEVVPVYRRRPFYWRRHLARLTQSLQKIKLDFDVDSLLPAAELLIEECKSPEQVLYIQITRGEMQQRRLRFAATAQPTVFMMATERAPIAPEKLTRGVSCRRAQDIRWSRCDIKSTSLLGAALLAAQAADDEEEVLIFRDGLLLEGGNSNVILVKGEALYMPPPSERLLDGITTQVLRQQARAGGIKLIESDIPAAAVSRADEILLASSLREILPVTRLDGEPVGKGKPGAMFKRLYKIWRAHVKSGFWYEN